MRELIEKLEQLDQPDLEVTLDGCVPVKEPFIELVWPGDYKPKVPVVTFGVED